MSNQNLQITIRGLDTQTKQALVNKAKQQGLSLNQYALRILQKNVGFSDSNNRYQSMKQFLNLHHISDDDNKAVNEVLAWSDSVSIAKQQQEQV